MLYLSKQIFNMFWNNLKIIKTQREVQEILIEYDNVAIDSEDYENYMKEIIIDPLKEKLKNEPI